ncbi:MAG: hypothetical protein NC395_11570 [Prevotella sp.]|nr:hypothetical protein [Prevotella sp.]
MSRSRSAEKKVSAVSVIEIIFIVILILIMVFMLALNFLFKKNNEAASIFGYSFYNTKAVNMLPDFPKNTVVIAKASEKKNIKENSVILCKIGETTALIRVTEVGQDDGGKLYYRVKFDTAPAKDAVPIGEDAVIAKAMWQINGLGAFLDFAKSTVGVVIAVVIPLIFIIAIQVSRILGIKRLEEEAASLDDIDGFIQSRDEESPAPVTFTEPKFVEDVTGKLPQVGGDRRGPEPRPEKVLTFDKRGRAEYSERTAEEKKESPLFTYDRLTDRNEAVRREPAYAGAAPRDELYMNRPTKIEPEKNGADELFEKYASAEKSEPVVFTPHLSNIIPDSIAAVQEEAAAVKKPGADENAKPYFEKNARFESDEKVYTPDEERPAIPENAVLPKETIAPPKKQKSNKALAELMSIIDAEENKLKK